jgi:KDO2-lipid IV(A) lauroyltransferase
VEFFGRTASTHKAIALFSLTSDAPLIFSYTRRCGHILRHLLATDGELDPRTAPANLRSVPALTQWYTRLLERTIRVAPDQYWWLHRRWRDEPAKEIGRGRAA